MLRYFWWNGLVYSIFFLHWATMGGMAVGTATMLDYTSLVFSWYSLHKVFIFIKFKVCFLPVLRDSFRKVIKCISYYTYIFLLMKYISSSIFLITDAQASFICTKIIHHISSFGLKINKEVLANIRKTIYIK